MTAGERRVARRAARPATIAGIGLVGIALAGLLGLGLTSSIVYSSTPTELARQAEGRDVRLVGVLVDGSARWDARSGTLRFQVTDGTTTVPVTSRDLPTGILRDGMAVVLVGRPTPSGFVATELMAKHSETYRGLAPGETMPPSVLQGIDRASTP